MLESRPASASSSNDSFLAPGNDEASYAPLLVSQGNSSPSFEDLNPFASPVSTTIALLSPGAAGPHEGHITRPSAPSTPPPPSASEKDVEGELRDIVDSLLRKKRAARDTLAEQNASLRAQVSLLQDALVQASARPASSSSTSAASVLPRRPAAASRARQNSGSSATEVRCPARRKLRLSRWCCGGGAAGGVPSRRALPTGPPQPE